MAKTTVNINGKSVKIDTDRPAVAKALVALVEACAVRTWKIGTILEHENGCEYILCKNTNDGRAYLYSIDTGRARNSRKVVRFMGDDPANCYTEDLPCEHDRFYDPEKPGNFIDI